MTWNGKKKRVDPQGYYVLKAIYQTADVNNSYLFLCLGNFFPLCFGVNFTKHLFHARFSVHCSKEVDFHFTGKAVVCSGSAVSKDSS